MDGWQRLGIQLHCLKTVGSVLWCIHWSTTTTTDFASVLQWPSCYLCSAYSLFQMFMYSNIVGLRMWAEFYWLWFRPWANKYYHYGILNIFQQGRSNMTTTASIQAPQTSPPLNSTLLHCKISLWYYAHMLWWFFLAHPIHILRHKAASHGMHCIQFSAVLHQPRFQLGRVSNCHCGWHCWEGGMVSPWYFVEQLVGCIVLTELSHVSWVIITRAVAVVYVSVADVVVKRCIQGSCQRSNDLSRTVDGCCRVLAVSVLESLCVTSKYNALVITVCFAANVWINCSKR